MKERPIQFSTPMVQAILEGRKTQTRRVVKNATGWDHNWQVVPVNENNLNGDPLFEMRCGHQYSTWFKCPYGKPGDLLWVRETWCRATPPWDGCDPMPPFRYYYRADKDWHGMEWSFEDKDGPQDSPRWKPSIHMPKAAARIWLQVENIRVERLHDITASDAMDEGVEDILFNKKHPLHLKACENGIWDADERAWYTGSVDAFKALWQSINGEESWEANPWVWVVEFKRVER